MFMVQEQVVEAETTATDGATAEATVAADPRTESASLHLDGAERLHSHENFYLKLAEECGNVDMVQVIEKSVSEDHLAK